MNSDSRIAKRLNRVRSRLNNTDPGWVETPEYTIFSSVTGQQITTLEQTGLKNQTFIYMNGSVIAEQWVGGTTSSSITFKQSDPITGSERQTNVAGVVGTSEDERKDIGALGAVVPSSEPEVFPMPNYKQGGSIGNPEFGCMIDRMSVSCSQAFRLLESGAGEIGPLDPIAAWQKWVNPKTKKIKWKPVFWEQNAQGQLGYWSKKKSYTDTTVEGEEPNPEWDGEYQKTWISFSNYTNVIFNDFDEDVANLTALCINTVRAYLSKEIVDIIKENNKSSVPIPILIAHAAVESTLGTSLDGLAKEKGLFQLKPSTARGIKGINETFTDTQLRNDFSLNTRLATTHLQQLIDRQGSILGGLQEYKEGQGNLKNGVNYWTQVYAQGILNCGNSTFVDYNVKKFLK